MMLRENVDLGDSGLRVPVYWCSGGGDFGG